MLVVDVETIAIPDVETYIEPATAPANYKDPEKIKAYELEARNKQVERAALDIDLAQIVGIGIWTDGLDAPRVELVGDLGVPSEKDLLERFWASVRSEGMPLVTYNGLGYDVPLLMRRSLYLGIPCPQIQVDRFKHPQVIDLMQILSYDGKLPNKSLSFYANRFGLKTPEPDMGGQDIAAAWLTGDKEAVRRKCALDVEMTTKLGFRIHAMPAAASVF